MNILVGANTIEAVNCWVERYDTGKVVLKLHIRQDVIGHDELKNLLKNNTEDIILTKDDGSVEALSGFYYSIRVSDSVIDGEEIHDCEVECIGENEYQIGRLKNQIAEQNEVISNQMKIIAEMQAVNAALNDEILTTQMELCELYESNKGTENETVAETAESEEVDA